MSIVLFLFLSYIHSIGENLMKNAELIALQTVRDEYEKIREKYKKKAIKEREKVNDVYVMVCGEKCYTDAEINDWYANDYITCEQSDKYIERLNKKKTIAGHTGMVTKRKEYVEF